MRDRDVPLTPKLLEELRDYWRWEKPRVYLFPSKMGDPSVEQPISDKTVWNACRAAAARAGMGTSHESNRLNCPIFVLHLCVLPHF